MKCYICGEPSTSSEHAPAKCFFPKEKRKNLIKVPSCFKHNEDTSKDDKYVRNIIAMSIGNNGVAQKLFLDKCVKSFQKSQGLYIETTKERKVILLEKQNKKTQKSFAFKINLERFEIVIKKIAYALFFSKYGTIWNKEFIIGTTSLLTEDLELDSIGKLIAGIEKEALHFEGENLDVFKYIFLNPNSEDIQNNILHMVFYEGFEVWIFPNNDTNQPNL